MRNISALRVILLGSCVPDNVRKGYIPGKGEIIKFQIPKLFQENILEKYNITRIFCAPDIQVSPEHFLSKYSIELETKLENRNYGIWAGQKLKNLSVEDQMQFMNPTYSPIGGESICAFHIRLKSWLDSLFNKAQNQDTFLVIASPVIIRTLSACILDDDIKNSFHILNKLDIYPESWSVFSGRSGKWRILTLSAPF
ncbi:histidine phosphatase family protein [Acetobacter pasteurianus]|uniref:histidine phosphatase family protein n=1 Tax=Acetobacter pasteurianus TaxID=438 RepID=UPI003D131660